MGVRRQKRTTTKRAARSRRPARVSLDFLKFEFGRTQNPVYAWEAIAAALTNATDIPAFAARYLRMAAIEMSHLTRTAIPRKNETARAVYHALGFKNGIGAVNPFRVLSDTSHNMMVAFEVWEKLRDGHKLDNALTDVAEEHPQRCLYREACSHDPRSLKPHVAFSRSSVRRAWIAHEREFKKS